MIRFTQILVIITLLISCSSTKNVKPTITPEIDYKTLTERGIAPMHPKYKNSYFRILGYLFYNENDTFNTIQGDFFNVKHKNLGNLNLMVGFWKKYGKDKNLLDVSLAQSETSKPLLQKLEVKVSSSKHGDFKIGAAGDDEISIKQQRRLYLNNLNIKDNQDLLNQIFDDVITVTIRNETYTFLNPQLQLE